MVTLKFLMKSGVMMSHRINGDAAGAEQICDTFHNLVYLSGKDTDTGEFFFVRPDDVSAMTARVD